MAHIKIGEDYGGAQRGAPYANVAKICHPPGTYVAPDVDHVASYTWNWLCQICHGPVGGCVECAQ